MGGKEGNFHLPSYPSLLLEEIMKAKENTTL